MKLFSFVEVELRSRKPTGARGIQQALEDVNKRSRTSTGAREAVRTGCGKSQTTPSWLKNIL